MNNNQYFSTGLSIIGDPPEYQNNGDIKKNPPKNKDDDDDETIHPSDYEDNEHTQQEVVWQC